MKYIYNSKTESKPNIMKYNKIVKEKSILLVTYILASSCGVLVTYFEWVKNNQGYYWSEEKVEKKLNNIMTNAFEKIYHTSQIRKVDMRLASHMVGVRKMAEASRYRGWV